jgi:uncharacterized repeat protein (TIGR01451 family)
MRKLLFLTLTALLFMAVVAAPPILAAGTPVGTSISNQATGTYNDANGNAMTPVLSNPVIITVSQVYALDISPVTSSASGTNEQYVYFPGRVDNTGNGSDTFTISWASTGDTWVPDEVLMYADVNNNGVYDAGTDTLISPITPGGNAYLTPSLAADAFTRVIMAVKVPANATAPNGTSNLITVTVTSNNDASKTMTATCTTTVLAAVVVPSISHTVTTYRPGDEVTWIVSFVNNGSANATNIQATHVLSTNLTFVPGSIEVNLNNTGWQPRADACTSAAACYDAANRRILVPGDGVLPSPYYLEPGWNYQVRIRTTINAGVPSGTTITAIALIGYTSGASDISVNTNTDSILVQNLAAIDLNKGTPESVNKSGNPSDYITYSFQAVNNGNAGDKIDLTVNSSNGWTWLLYHDSNNNRVYDAGTDTLLTDTGGAAAVDTGTLVLNGGLINLIARAQIPAGRADTTTDTLIITGASVNDPTKTDTVSWTSTVTGPYLVITKELVLVTHTANIGGSVPANCVPTDKSKGDGCNYYPGSTMTYQVTARNTGSGNATAVMIADAVPGNTTYVAESIRVGETVALLAAKTDANDGDGGRYDGSSIIAGGNSGFVLGPNATQVLEFKVRIN